MKKFLWIFFMVLFPSLLFGQADSTKTTRSFLNLMYGTRLPNNNFYNQINTLSTYKFNNPLQVIGIGLTAAIPWDGRYGTGNIFGNWSYSQVLPKSININDSIKVNINGFVVGFDIAGFAIFKKSKVFRMLGSTGFNTGRLRLHGNEWARQKNPFFSPKISIQPIIRIHKILFSVIASYEYDISSPNWRRTYFADKNKITLDKFKETGATIFFCLGFPMVAN